MRREGEYESVAHGTESDLERAGRKRMETRFQQELNQLKSELLPMAGLAERAISNAVEALVKHYADARPETRA